MKQIPNLIVMLTYNDHTVPNAAEIFEACRGTKAACWGFKEEGLPLPEMEALFRRMRDCGKHTVLEVVAYTEEECLAGARMAVRCGCEILAGTLYFPSVHALCREHGLRYFPFVGKVSQRPSILEGSAEEMIREAGEYLRLGADGIDLLGYRYTGDAAALNRRFVEAVPAPVVVAGSVNSFARLDEIKALSPWGFTIGSAFFDGCFGPGGFAAQIDRVCDYLAQP